MALQTVVVVVTVARWGGEERREEAEVGESTNQREGEGRGGDSRGEGRQLQNGKWKEREEVERGR